MGGRWTDNILPRFHLRGLTPCCLSKHRTFTLQGKVQSLLAALHRPSPSNPRVTNLPAHERLRSHGETLDSPTTTLHQTRQNLFELQGQKAEALPPAMHPGISTETNQPHEHPIRHPFRRHETVPNVRSRHQDPRGSSAAREGRGGGARGLKRNTVLRVSPVRTSSLVRFSAE